LCVLWDCIREHFSDQEGFLPPLRTHGSER
jgi:hypothetical protein